MTSQVLLNEGVPALSESSAAPVVTPFDDLASVVATYEQRIFRFLLVSLRDRDAAQSLTQDTFLRAWSARASFRGDCAIFSSRGTASRPPRQSNICWAVSRCQPEGLSRAATRPAASRRSSRGIVRGGQPVGWTR